MPDLSFRQYLNSDLDHCLEIFDRNCPEFFATNEREDYFQFLNTDGDDYQVCLMEGNLCGAFGVYPDVEPSSMRIKWILLDPQFQRIGLGSTIMKRAIDTVRQREGTMLKIAASQKSAPFFSRFGAQIVARIENGWGIGMHRYDMQLRVEENSTSE